MTEQLPSGEVADARVDPNGTVREPASAPARPAPRARAYPYRQPFTWWMRRRGYLLYIVRELTAVPVAAWMVIFVVEISRLHQGSAGYQSLFASPLFIAVSVVCLIAALWHSFTFLSLAGLIIRIPVGDRSVPPRMIVGAMFTGFVVLSAVIAGLMIWGGL